MMYSILQCLHLQHMRMFECCLQKPTRDKAMMARTTKNSAIPSLSQWKHGNTLIMQSTRFKSKYYTPVSNIIEHYTAKEGEKECHSLDGILRFQRNYVICFSFHVPTQPW